MKNLTGRVFGKFTALKRARPALRSGKRKRATWVCLCACGNVRVIRTDQLLSGRRTGCGCGRACLPKFNSGNGWTRELHNTAKEKQKNLCAICKRPERMKGKSLSKDHDHETGKPRELLCFHCNL